MQILALDTSMGACSAALLQESSGGRVLAARSQRMDRGHAEALMPMVAEVMSEASTRFGELDLIAATLGPGSFTGVRVAIAAARGLALVTRATCWGTDSLTVMARGALSEMQASGGRPSFAVAVDARRGMIYFGMFEQKGRRLAGPLLLSPEEAAARLSKQVRLAVGSGAAMLAEAAARQGAKLEARLPDLQPDASALAELASEAEGSMQLRPLYLRPPDAKPQAASIVARQ